MKYPIFENLTFGDSGDQTSILTWKKYDANSFERTLDELSNHVFRFSLRCLGAELVRVFLPPPPPPPHDSEPPGAHQE